METVESLSRVTSTGDLTLWIGKILMEVASKLIVSLKNLERFWHKVCF